MTALRALMMSGAVLVSWSIGPAQASAWELFRSENGHVRDGNEALAAGDPAGALADYDEAALELPSEAGVHLDRGLALLASGEHGLAREAFQHATDPPAPREIRASAHYDIGLSFYQEADTAATADDHETAQRMFREAADAFRASLRQQPGNRDAAWNLELALRRLQEQEQAQEQQEQEEQEQQEDQNQQQEDQEPQDGEQDQEQQDGEQQDGEQDPDQQEQEQQDGEQDDSQDPQEQQDGEAQDGEQDDSQDPQDQQDQQGEPEEQDPQPGDGSSPGDAAEEEAQTGGTTDRSMPQDQQRVLDALEDSEENFQGARARARGDRERRRVTQDW